MKQITSICTAAAALFLTACSGGSDPVQATAATATTPASLTTPELNTTQKYALAYMWHEEKLAYDLYIALDTLYGAQPFYKIAANSEINHMGAVEILVKNYDINITNLQDYTVAYSEAQLRALEPGKFAVPELQTLYDTLINKGSRNLQEALEAACMVEVTDVDDLDAFLVQSEGFDDIVTAFEWLRAGSYKHYWAFDGALKTLGIVEGCCSLGSEYCKTAAEYPNF